MICTAKVKVDVITVTMKDEKPIVLRASGSAWSKITDFMVDGGTFGSDSSNTFSGGEF